MDYPFYIIFVFRLFHELSEGIDQFVNDVVASVADVVHHAGFDMVREKLLIECVQCGIDCCDLSHDIGAICVFFDHALDTADLPFDTAQAVDEFFVFLGRSLLGFMARTAAFFDVIHGDVLLFPLKNKEASDLRLFLR